MGINLRTYAWTVAALGIAAAALSPALLPLGITDTPRILLLGVVALLSVLMPLRFRRRGGTQGFHVEGGVLVAILLSAPAALAAPVLVVSSLIGHAIRSRDLTKTVFNAGQTGIQAGAGAALFTAIAGGAVGPTSGVAVAGALAAALVYEVISVVLMTELFHRMDGAARSGAAREVSRFSAVTLIANAIYGVILATSLAASLWVGALAGAAMIGLFVGYRGLESTIEREERAQALNVLTRRMLDMPRDVNAVSALMAGIAETFGARKASLLFMDADGPLIWQWEAGSPDSVTRIKTLPIEGPLGHAMRTSETVLHHPQSESGEIGLVAPLRRGDRQVGGMVLVGRLGLEDWDEGDRALLATIANELVVTLENRELFAEVERERARLQAESTKLADILGAATDGIALIRGDGTVETWNPGMSAITGVRDEQAVGQPWFVVMRIRDEAGSELMPDTQHPVAMALRGNHRLDQPVLIQAMRRDGTWRWLSCTVAPVAAHGETPEGSVLVARDVTAEHEVGELKSDFIATVSHELRTPLTPLKGFISTLRRTSEPERSRGLDRVLEAMGNQVNRLEALISDLLAVAELETGHFDVNPERVDLVDHVWVAAEVEAGVATERLSLDVRQNVSAIADPLALTRIVRALVSNAVKHTDGRIVIRIDEADGRALVRVIDEGPGIAPWEHDRIFDRFERLGDHLRRTQGPGLGLTIARALAQRQQGQLTLESDVGTGSTFTVSLPAAQRPRLRLASSE